jgi:ferredoxin
MRAVVDLDTCQGYANCIVEAPDVFDLDEETNKVVLLIEAVPPDLEDDARRAAASCPVTAIALED